MVVSLNSRLESNKEEEEVGAGGGSPVVCLGYVGRNAAGEFDQFAESRSKPRPGGEKHSENDLPISQLSR